MAKINAKANKYLVSVPTKASQKILALNINSLRNRSLLISVFSSQNGRYLQHFCRIWVKCFLQYHHATSLKAEKAFARECFFCAPVTFHEIIGL